MAALAPAPPPAPPPVIAVAVELVTAAAVAALLDCMLTMSPELVDVVCVVESSEETQLVVKGCGGSRHTLRCVSTVDDEESILFPGQNLLLPYSKRTREGG